jgi:hypothetical protein
MKDGLISLYFSGVKQLKAFGLGMVLVLSLSQLPWMWRDRTAVKEAKYKLIKLALHITLPNCVDFVVQKKFN